MKRCETSLTRSRLRHADGSRPCLVRALTRRTPITCMLIWHCTEQVIVIASVNVAPRSLTKRFVSVKYRKRGGHEDKQDAPCSWCCGPFVGGREQRRVRSRPTRAISTVIGGGNRSGRVLGSDPAAHEKSGDIQGRSVPRPT